MNVDNNNNENKKINVGTNSFFTRTVIVSAAISFLVGVIGANIVNISSIGLNNNAGISKQPISKEFKTAVTTALANRFSKGDVYEYSLVLNGYNDSVVSVNDSGEMFIQTPTVLGEDTETTDDSEVFYIDTAYLSSSGDYYKANNNLNEEDEIETTWVKYNDDMSDIVENKKVAFTNGLLENTTNIEHTGKVDISADLLQVDVYKLSVNSDIFYNLFSSELVRTYESLITEAGIEGDTEFKEYNKEVLTDVNMMSVFADGYVEVGIKDEKLYYLGFITGGGGSKVVAQITFSDQMTENKLAPDLKEATTLYEDAKKVYDTALEEHIETEEHLAATSEENVNISE